MGFVLENLLLIILVVVLLAVSALFSGAETVLFSLSRHDRARMKKNAGSLEAMAAALLDNPRGLLTSLLLGNQLCNIMTFVISAILIKRFGVATANADPNAALTLRDFITNLGIAALVAVPPLMVTYVTDVFPKVIGSLNNTRIAPLIALPITTLVRVMGPVTRALDMLVMKPVHRLVGTRRDQLAFSTGELRELLEMSQEQGVIDVSENQLLQEVLRIADLRVRDVMTPRVDMVAYNVKDTPDKLLAILEKSHLAKVPVYDGQIDSVLGLIYAKTILLEPDPRKIDPRRLVQPVHFVPELQSLERLLLHFRQTKSQLAIVVDEFGGVVGVVALEDVVEQMVGDIYEPHDSPRSNVQKVGEDEYAVAGDLTIADWVEAFGARMDAVRTTTVAGLIAAMLKRVPRVGDVVRLQHLEMTVESMRGRRVDRVRLKLISPDATTEGTMDGGGI